MIAALPLVVAYPVAQVCKSSYMDQALRGCHLSVLRLGVNNALVTTTGGVVQPFSVCLPLFSRGTGGGAGGGVPGK